MTRPFSPPPPIPETSELNNNVNHVSSDPSIQLIETTIPVVPAPHPENNSSKSPAQMSDPRKYGVFSPLC